MAKEKAGKPGKSSEEPKTERKKSPAKSAKSTPAPSVKKKASPAKKAAAPKGAAKATKTASKQTAAKTPAKKPGSTKASAAKPTAPAKSSSANGTSSATPDARLREEFRRIEEDPRELPLDYGETKVVLLTRDPEWIFAYWEMSPGTRAEFGLTRGQHQKTLVLRTYDLETGRPGQGAAHFDVSVNDYTSSWYIRVPRAGTTYLVQLGLLEKDRFRPICSSNPLHIPRRGISQETDVQFAEINDEVYEQIVHLSGGVRISERLGSDDFLRSLQQRVFAGMTDGPFSSAGLSSGLYHGMSSGVLGGSSEALSSGAFSSGAFFSELSSGMLTGGAGEETLRNRAGGPEREFWLEAGVDVIVYGATEPDARVTFMGQEIRLTSDGTFRVRMVLPDSSIEFPIEARSADGKERRFVKPVVTRQTEGDPRKPS